MALSPLGVQLFGGFHLTYGDVALRDINRPRMQSLLAYLILHAGTLQARQHIAFLFWPDLPEAHARNNLRQVLHQLRQVLPESSRFLTLDAQTVGWRSDDGQNIDVQIFRRALADAEAAARRANLDAEQSALEHALTVYQGDLFPACYDDWIASERERLRQQCQAACRRLGYIFEQQRQYAAALEATQQLLRLDPLDELTYVALMRLHELNGDNAGAQRIYQTAAKMLQRELEVNPGAELSAAYERLQHVSPVVTPAGVETPSTSTPFSLVGRQAEWQHLQKAWGRAVNGHPHLVLIRGEAGIGKSNLISTLSSVGGIITNGSSDIYEWSLLSTLGRINYNYNNKYYLTASLRSDGSSRFGINNKYGVFPSAALAWRISDEAFLKDVSFLNDLKLRLSYGQTGNNNIGNYEQYATVNYEKYVTGGTAVGGYAPGRLANPDLTWEKQKSVNLGVDIKLFNSRLGITVDHYQSKNYDLLLNVNVPATTGFTTALQNIGEVKNQGWEFGFNTVNIKNEFEWTTDFNFSFNDGQVIKLGPQGDPIINGGNITMIGQPVGMFYGWIGDGIFKDQSELDAGPIFNPGARDMSRVGDVRFKDISGPQGKPDGVINSFDKAIIGSPYPDFMFGMTNRFAYRNISLSISLQGVQGNKVLDLQRTQSANDRARFRQYSYMNNYWKSPQEPGNGTAPRPNDTPTGNWRGEFSSLWLDDASYLRINNINLAYMLPDSWMKKAKINSARVYVTATNPFLFTDYVGFNPDISRNSNPLTPGNSNYDFPTSKSIVVGMNLSF